MRLRRLDAHRSQSGILSCPSKLPIYSYRLEAVYRDSEVVHPRVEALLRPLWVIRDKPEGKHVFLNRLGEPYTDTRDLAVQGGNPLSSAHKTACKRKGIDDFTVHDWRHHWASHCVMSGVDLITIMRLGGWKSLRLVQRYAAVDTRHMDRAVMSLV